MSVLPSNYTDRPVTVLGGGVLGRRIACVWASGGYDVQVRDSDAKQHQPCVDYVRQNVDGYPASGTKRAGTVRCFRDLESAVENAWLVVEVVPERIENKTDAFAELDAAAPADAILASNSSSYRSSEMLAKVAADGARERIMNTHYYMPPADMVVELMTDGHTRPEYFPFMTQRLREVGGNDPEDVKAWGVGISVAPKLGRFYWTQKGAPKSGQGRIFCADVNMPEGKTAETRDDVECFLDKLPECIDLEVDEDADAIFWTDRGEIPKGNTLNKASIDPETGLLRCSGPERFEILVRHLSEAIGVKLDKENGHVYFGDLGGSIYRCNVDGSGKKKLFSDDDRAISGIALLRN